MQSLQTAHSQPLCHKRRMHSPSIRQSPHTRRKLQLPLPQSTLNLQASIYMYVYVSRSYVRASRPTTAS